MRFKRNNVYALQVRGVISNCDDPRHFNTTYVSERLHISPRQLSRKLNEENTMFKDIVDEVRMTLCHEMMEEGITRADVYISRLGMCDVSHFYRKFPKWFGITFAEYKNTIKERVFESCYESSAQ